MRNLKVEKTADLEILFPIEKYLNNYDHYKKRIERVNYGEVYNNIIVWNLQSLNLNYKRREVKVDFLKYVLNNNKADFVYLIDVNNFRQGLILNGYNKFDDGRNLLFVNNNILENFIIDKEKSFIYSKDLKIVFTYVTPNTNNKEQIDEIKNKFKEKYAIFADFNINSNKELGNFVEEFYGEDNLRIGLIGQRPKKFFSLSGPSDHYLMLYIIKKKIHFNFPLRVKEISIEHSKKNVFNILNGIDGDYRPTVKFIQSKINYSDGEDIIDKMLSDYIENKVERVYKKYNYLWKFSKKEPFLGTKVPTNVVSTFAKHLKEDKNKEYLDCKFGNRELSKFNIKTKIKETKSKALTNEYMALGSITKALKEYFDNKFKNNVNSNTFDYDIINNVIKIANLHKCFLIANTFFLLKNPKLEDFADVRMIVIIPSVIKIYEALIYNEVVPYLSQIIGSKGVYQYGGVIGGSTYEAIYALRNKYVELEGKGILCCDMSKGYDTVDLCKLKEVIEGIGNERIKFFLLNWYIMIHNMDIKMNETLVQRSRGIAMGLSLSPIMFTFYVHKCLEKFDVKFFVMYVDDLCIVIKSSLLPIDALKFVNEVIDHMATFGLVINKKKTMLITINSDLESCFKNTFPVVTEDKYLGCELGLNNDGFLVADDRFYNNNSSKVRAFPNFNIFGIRRILFITALDAKSRYRFMCWSTGSKTIRGSIFKRNWYFFKSNNVTFSYVQMIFSIFNVFRFFLDSLEVDKIILDLEKGLDIDALSNVIKEKLMTGVDQIDKAIYKIKFDFSYVNHDNKLEQSKKFCDKIFEDIKVEMLESYIKEKKDLGFPTFRNIFRIVKTRWFRNFSIVQNLAFIHEVSDRNKQILIFDVLQVLEKNLDLCFNKVGDNYQFKNFVEINGWVFDEIAVPKDLDNPDSWCQFIKLYSIKFWKILDFCIIVDETITKDKHNEEAKKLFKSLFKIFTILETIVNNKNLNSLSLEILEISFKAKRVALDHLADKFYDAVCTHDDIEVFDHDILNI